jgi:hypothetical protein
MAVASIGSTLALMLVLNMVGSCGGEVKIIACIEDPEIIEKILSHLDAKSDTPANHLPKSRAAPRGLPYTNRSSEN